MSTNTKKLPRKRVCNLKPEDQPSTQLRLEQFGFVRQRNSPPRLVPTVDISDSDSSTNENVPFINQDNTPAGVRSPICITDSDCSNDEEVEFTKQDSTAGTVTSNICVNQESIGSK